MVVLALIMVTSRVYQGMVVSDQWNANYALGILQFVLVLLVASIPVAMPAVFSITMALGALGLSKQKAIVSKLSAIEEMAGVDILCSDKDRHAHQELFLAILLTQVFAVLMCGFGWLVPQIPWQLVGAVWLYNLIWMFVLGAVRLITDGSATIEPSVIREASR